MYLCRTLQEVVKLHLRSLAGLALDQRSKFTLLTKLGYSKGYRSLCTLFDKQTRAVTPCLLFLALF